MAKNSEHWSKSPNVTHCMASRHSSSERAPNLGLEKLNLLSTSSAKSKIKVC